MNNAILSGIVATEPETTYTMNGHARCTFRLAVRRSRKGQDGKYETDFFSVTAWNKTAEACGKYLGKGKRCMVQGRMETFAYTAQDGTKRSGVQMVAENVEFLSDNRHAAQGDAESAAGGMEGFTQVDDDELPF